MSPLIARRSLTPCASGRGSPSTDKGQIQAKRSGCSKNGLHDFTILWAGGHFAHLCKRRGAYVISRKAENACKECAVFVAPKEEEICLHSPQCERKCACDDVNRESQCIKNGSCDSSWYHFIFYKHGVILARAARVWCRGADQRGRAAWEAIQKTDDNKIGGYSLMLQPHIYRVRPKFNWTLRQLKDQRIRYVWKQVNVARGGCACYRRGVTSVLPAFQRKNEAYGSRTLVVKMVLLAFPASGTMTEVSGGSEVE
ncbi:hypothetical protein EVAR_80143_1 [Eumeta japonica]|uniref:Uncharacterized protein n=1 Tax=Eumeta variegata TaxID=151549 RepID=A0A4C1YIC0_EUMVA|nr:hypothetical protein EVAR_80143_1 [Eumeta japonica]